MPKHSITHWPKSAKPELCPDEAHRASGAGFPAGSRVSTRLESESKPATNPLDPYYAANPRLWVTTFLQFQPDAQQAALLDAHHPYLLLNCTRQWGKTTVIAAKALHFAFFHPRTTTLVAAPSERQSLTLLRHLKSFLQILGLDPQPIPSMPLSLRLPNGSEIIALPACADTIRGFTAHLLIFDEAARVPDSLYHALSPARATTNGPLWLLSTPNGPTGFFYEAWHEDNLTPIQGPLPDPQGLAPEDPQDAKVPEPGESGLRLCGTTVDEERVLHRDSRAGPLAGARPPGRASVRDYRPSDPPEDLSKEQVPVDPAPSSPHRWARFLVPATECPRIAPAFLDHERLILGDIMFRQEYLCEFTAGPHTFISPELLASAIDPSIEPLFTEPLFSGPTWNRS